MKRIDFLDAFRGLAILLVVFFHAYTRWCSFLPYGKKFFSFFFFRYGYLGVQLFFLISGFVILMTLEKSKSFYQFIYKRWLRLFPAMLITSLFIFIASRYFYERPTGVPELKSIIPGILFLDPLIIEEITHQKINPLEGSFWSLFVEVKFYLIFGLLYYIIGKVKAIGAIFMMFLFSVLCRPYKFLYLITINLSLEHFGWFAIGAIAYLYFTTRKKSYLIFLTIMSLLQIAQYRHEVGSLILTILIVGIFLTPIFFDKARNIFNNKFLLFFGFISYPLYLIHENSLIAMINKLYKYFPQIPDLLLPVIPIIILCLIAYIIAKAEPFIKNKIIQLNIVKL